MFLCGMVSETCPLAAVTTPPVAPTTRPSSTVRRAVADVPSELADTVVVRPVTPSAGDSLLVRGSAHEFGPAGTKFLQPVLLTLRYDPASIPLGVEPSTLGLLRSDGGAFAPLVGAVVDTLTRTATAPISGFSSYSVGYV